MKTKRLTALAMLTALSLVIFIIEAQLPPPAPIPGIKLGLANAVTLLTMKWYGRRGALAVLLLRIVIGAIFTGNMTSLIYSLSGGLLCFAVTAAVISRFDGKRLWAVSVLGAVAHNIGQIAAAIVMTSVPQVAAYLPVLIISGIITGAFTGVIAGLIVNNKAINKLLGV